MRRQPYVAPMYVLGFENKFSQISWLMRESNHQWQSVLWERKLHNSALGNPATRLERSFYWTITHFAAIIFRNLQLFLRLMIYLKYYASGFTVKIFFSSYTCSLEYCKPYFCLNSGSRVAKNDSYICICPVSYTGERCQRFVPSNKNYPCPKFQLSIKETVNRLQVINNRLPINK